MIVVFLIAFILNTIAALGIKEIAMESDMKWPKTKLARIIFLIPPVSVIILVIIWITMIIIGIIDGAKEYLD
jgi:hypothetical protein